MFVAGMTRRDLVQKGAVAAGILVAGSAAVRASAAPTDTGTIQGRVLSVRGGTLNVDGTQVSVPADSRRYFNAAGEDFRGFYPGMWFVGSGTTVGESLRVSACWLDPVLLISRVDAAEPASFRLADEAHPARVFLTPDTSVSRSGRALTLANAVPPAPGESAAVVGTWDEGLGSLTAAVVYVL